MKILSAGVHMLKPADLAGGKIGIDAAQGDVSVVLPTTDGYGGSFLRLDDTEHAVTIDAPHKSNCDK